MISGFRALRQVRAQVAGLESATEGSAYLRADLLATEPPTPRSTQDPTTEMVIKRAFSAKSTEVPRRAFSAKSTEVPRRAYSVESTEVPRRAYSVESTEVPRRAYSVKSIEVPRRAYSVE
ncbi:erythrocyte binding protein 3 [Plakobranchus ocellatus]|uniref:Erythrocyte binding protein 3 n=1 Tax=Plakobranchus ocellatus TaxID=259542 RepID=A0AAV4C2M5_9GAST|nr:erythrocyte binding protein 3 [Plakobranchus ocellatus]